MADRHKISAFCNYLEIQELIIYNSDSEDFDADYDMFSRDSDSNE